MTAPAAPHRAEGLAAQIEADIEAAGWPIGESLGSEIELCQHYGVGRGVLREAIRLLEHHSVARMKAGRAGGLVVTEPDIGSVARVAALLLRRMKVRSVHLIEARRTIEMTCVRVAAEQIDEAGVQRLRECLDREVGADGRDVRASRHEAGRFHVLLAELTGNPALRLFSDVCVTLTENRLPAPARPHRTFREAHGAHTAIAEAIIAGDIALAQHRMNAHYSAMARAWSAGPAMVDSLPESAYRRPAAE